MSEKSVLGSAARHRILGVRHVAIWLGGVAMLASGRAEAEAPSPSGFATRDLAAQQNEKAPLCKVCPCTVAEREVPQPPEIVLQVKPMLDLSTSMVCAVADGCEGQSTLCNVDERDRFLQIGKYASQKPKYGWEDAVDKALNTAETTYRRHRLSSRSWRMLKEEVVSDPKHGVQQFRRQRYSPIANVINNLTPSEFDVCSADPKKHIHTVALLLSDGLDHEKTAPPEAMMRKLVAALGAGSLRPRKISVFFGKLHSMSRELLRDPTRSQRQSVASNICEVLKAALLLSRSGTPSLEFQCVREDLEPIPSLNLSLSKKGAVCGDFATQLGKSMGSDYAANVHEKLEKTLESYLERVADEIAERAQNECPRTVTRYEPIQTAPTDIADGILVGNAHAFTCSGVAIAEDVVLTAAHCLPLTRVMVTEDMSSGGAIHEIISVARHPEAQVDVALVRTRSKVTEKPALMRESKDTDAPNGVLRFVGFGATDAAGRSGFGKKHFIDLQASGWGCDGDRPHRTGCRPGFEMVLPGSQGRDTCAGDSGGPVYELWGNGQQCGFRLIGVTARRTADSIVPCGNGGVYTRIDAVREWIDERMKGWKLAGGMGEER